MYIDDLIREVGRHFHVVAYADDITVIVENTDPNEIIHDVRSTLDIINNWSNRNNMIINFAKTKIMSLGFDYPSNDYVYEGNPIEIVRSLNILGIVVDSNLDFKKHLQNISNKISPILGILNKNKKSIKIDMRIKIYKSLLLPKILYGILAWYTNKQINKKNIGMIHKRCLRTINNKWTSTNSLMKKYGLWDIDQHYKYIINSRTKMFLDNNMSHSIQAYCSKRIKDNITINIPSFRLYKYKTSPLFRKISEFNKLPKNLRNKNLNYIKFQNQLKNHILI